VASLFGEEELGNLKERGKDKTATKWMWGEGRADYIREAVKVSKKSALQPGILNFRLFENSKGLALPHSTPSPVCELLTEGCADLCRVPRYPHYT
jgi:hypothetical protein